MFTTEIQKNGVCCECENQYVFYRKNGNVYIRNHKISELSVELIVRCQSKLLHLDVIYLSSAGRKSFREKLP